MNEVVATVDAGQSPERRSASIPFEVEARLLQELGERLVASPEVALLELIKNANDAEALSCKLILSSYRGKHALLIEDDGNGMSEADFRERWMRIATSSKKEAFTPRFGRPVTGQKGIGRFAIRFLGAALKLQSFSRDAASGRCYSLEAVFDWKRLDSAGSLNNALVSFRVERVEDDHPTGTQLRVWRLKQNMVTAVDKPLLTRVLKIASPIGAFDGGPFDVKRAKTKKGDPGFGVDFVGFPALPTGTTDIAASVLEHAWARVTISLVDDLLRYKIRFAEDGEVYEKELLFPNGLKRGLHADFAFTPKRKDAFLGVRVLRPEIWGWLKDNSGIGVVDNGFRIRPYGFNDDDWLYLNQDGSHNRREWRSPISEEHWPILPGEQIKPKLNPALNVAATSQLIGYVYVSSRASDDPEEADLIPAMDREGFLLNAGYASVVDIVRGGIEYLASVDKSRQLRFEEERAEDERESLRADLAETAAGIQADPRLAPEEKAALVQHFSQLATRLVKQEEYDRAARQRLEIAAGMGVVAGFMTHEAERLFLSLDDVIGEVRELAGGHPALASKLDTLTACRANLDGYIRYTRLYTDSLRLDNVKPFNAAGQIGWIKENFSHIAESRGIETEILCEEDVEVPAIPVALYSALVLNLYTNAAKAILARSDDSLPKTISISAWNDQRKHHLTVQDTGSGIPPELRERIWDPFYTTTSRVNSPLGSGMGLGLALVRELTERAGGSVRVDEPSPGFMTCMHIAIPRK
ncbi:sensor histidine kinase [Variovorax boronicumulans]|uniref:sensor histidine kinase n=1 Tax=Variovorax boronicumulans TaxID=436515 RepID=UPI0012E60924|nr:sensor histidine kinase [Variovorax boronicumulans]GER09855.1 sensor histidine kinase [Variovorax boronicumulans]